MDNFSEEVQPVGNTSTRKLIRLNLNPRIIGEIDADEHLFKEINEAFKQES